LRKKSGPVKFVEQRFMQNLLMWWNDGLGTDTIHMASALGKRSTEREQMTTPITRTNPAAGMASGLTGLQAYRFKTS
jgi:hypothetical protein